MPLEQNDLGGTGYNLDEYVKQARARGMDEYVIEVERMLQFKTDIYKGEN